MPSYKPLITKGVALEEVTLGLVTKGAVELAPLPSPGFYSCLFVVWKTSGSWRPVIDLSTLNRFVDVSHFQMETIQSVLLCSSGRLDGLHRSLGGVPPGSGSSGVSSLPPLCVQWSSLPIQSAVLWPIHGSTGLLSGHGSCFRHSLLDGYPHEQISRRLASPVLFSGVPSPGSPCSPVFATSWAWWSTPRSPTSFHLRLYSIFRGFSVARSHFQAAINRRRISILRLVYCKCLAVSSGDAFLTGSPGSRRQTAHAVSPAVPQQVLESCRRVVSCGLVCGVSSGPPVMAPPASPLPGCVSPPGVSRPRLLVRRLRRRVGCSSWSPRRFQPLGLGPGVSAHQRQRAAGHPARSPPLSVISVREDGRSLLRRQHCGGVSLQGGGNQVSLAEHHCSGDPALVGVTSHPSGSTIHPGLQQRPGERSVSPSSASAFRVVPQHDRVSVFVSSVADADRFVCDLRKSPLIDLFFSLPRPSVCGHGRIPPVLGRSSGLCLSSVCHHSQSSCETPGVSGDGAHPCGSALGAAPLVSGPPPAVAGPSGDPPRSSWPPAPASVLAPLPGSPQATASCLETLRRFTRAAGFSSAVARRPSSRAVYQLWWSVYRSLALPLRRWLIFWVGCGLPGALVSLPSVATAQCCLWSSAFASRPCPQILCCVTSLGLYVLLLGTCPGFCGFSTRCLSSLCRRLRFALCRRKHFFCWPSLRPNGLVSCRLFPSWSPLWVSMPASRLCRSLLPSRSRSPVPSLAPSWLSPCPILRLVLMTTFFCALCGPSAFILTGLGLCLLSAIAFLCRLVALLSLCPRLLCRSFCAMLFMPLGRLGLRWAPLGPMRSAVSPPLSLSTETGWFPQCLSPPLGAPVRCSHLFISATFNTNMMACSRWVHSWLRVRGLDSPHLFLTCSGGGGGAICYLFTLLRVSCTFPVTGCVACPSCCWTGARVHPFCILLRFYFSQFLFYFIYLYYACPSFIMSRGVYALWTHDVMSD